MALKADAMKMGNCGLLLLILSLLAGDSREQIKDSSDSLHIYGKNDRIFESNTTLNEISAKAFRHFLKHFPGISGEKWIKTPAGFIVSFVNAEARYKIFYSPRGNFEYWLKCYKPDYIPYDFSELFKSQFPGYEVITYTEINDDVNPFSIVKVENKRFIKTLQYYKGNLQTTDESINGRAN